MNDTSALGAERTSISGAPVGADEVLGLSGVTKIFGSLTAVSDVSLSVAAGEVMCLLGENGAGKSTLCNMIFGVYRPTMGAMRLSGAPYAPADPKTALGAGVGMVHQHFSLVPSMTVVDNLLLGRSHGVLKRRVFADEIRARAEEFGLKVDPWRIVKEMSVGERQRLEIVKCLMARPRLLLLDEPTAVLPPEEIGSFLDVCRRIADAGGALILVTHKLAEVAKIADRTAILRAGRIVDTVPMRGADMKAIVQAMIGRELGSADVAVGLDVAETGEPAAPASSEAVPAMPRRAGALQIDALSYRDRNGALRLDKITIEVGPGEIVGVAGVEGNGQTELGLILAGIERPSEGRWFVGDSEMTQATPREITAAGVGIVPEDRHAVGAVLDMSVGENLCLQGLARYTRFGLVRRGAITATANDLIERYDVRGAGPETRFGSLSGGNQQKVVLARELTLDPLVLLVAAQPTRGLDVGAVESVYGHIRSACQRGAGVLLISSELDELIAVSDRIAVIYRGRIVGELSATPANREAIGALMSGNTA
ncbi:MAG: ABC transporter ATP-binding protein [Xanthobacteraceae bacterium]